MLMCERKIEFQRGGWSPLFNPRSTLLSPLSSAVKCYHTRFTLASTINRYQYRTRGLFFRLESLNHNLVHNHA